jgi:hypothetical protein
VQRGINHTRCYLKYGCDEKSYSYEGTGYGHIVFCFMFAFVELLALTGFADLYRSEPTLRKMAFASQLSMFPDGSFLVDDNDLGLIGSESISGLLMLAKRFDDPQIRGFWDAFQGPQHPLRPYGDMRPWVIQRTSSSKSHPDSSEILGDPRSSHFYSFLYWQPEKPVTPLEESTLPRADYSPGTECINLRTSWGTDAVYANIQAAGRSRMSLTHRHADAGHFSIFAHGEYLAIDTGRYNSDEDQHSVVLVDGKPNVPIAPGWGMDFLSGRVSHYESQNLLTHARVDAAHLKGCHWANRDFLWVPLGGDDVYMVVIDNLNKDNARHTFWWQLQAHPDTKIEIDSDWQARICGEHARLDLSFIWPSAQDFPAAPHRFTLRQDVKEWQYPYGDDKSIQMRHEHEGLLYTSYLRPRLLGELDGLNGQMLTVVAPRRSGAAPLQVRRRMAKRLLWLEIETPIGRDTIITALDHGFIQTDEFRCMSEVLFLRHNAEGKRIAQWSLGGGQLEIPV